MNVNLKENYIKVLNDYNQSPFSKSDGWKCVYEEYTLTQIRLIYNTLQKGDNLLDIGTGHGIVPIFFKKNNYEVCTIDHFETGGEALKNIALFNIQTKNVNLNDGKLPFKDKSFNLIYMGDVIEHLPNSPKKILKECHRILKDNGSLIISTPNSIRLINKLKLLIGVSVWPKIESFYEDDYNGTHHHEYTLNELYFVMNKNHFKIDNVIYFEQNLHSDKRLKSIFGNLIKKILQFILFFFPKSKSNLIIKGIKI